MDKNIRTYYNELKQTPSIVFSKKWEPHILEKLVQYIQQEKMRLYKDACLLADANPDYSYPDKKDPVEYWLETISFSTLEDLEIICRKAFKEKTKQLQKPKPKYLDGETLTSPQIALIIYYKFESRYIFRTENQTKTEFIKDQIDELELRNSAKKVEIIFNTFYASNKRKEEKEIKTPLNIKNVETILPYLENYPIAKNKAENDLISLKNSE